MFISFNVQCSIPYLCLPQWDFASDRNDRGQLCGHKVDNNCSLYNRTMATLNSVYVCLHDARYESTMQIINLRESKSTASLWLAGLAILPEWRRPLQRYALFPPPVVCFWLSHWLQHDHRSLVQSQTWCTAGDVQQVMHHRWCIVSVALQVMHRRWMHAGNTLDRGL